MKIISLIFIAILLITTIWLGQKNFYLQKELVAKIDSLNCVKETLFQQRNQYAGYPIDSILKEAYLQTNDSILETHRISANYGDKFFLIRLELMKDSAVLVTSKRLSVRNIATGEGKNELLSVKTQSIEYKVLQQFRNKLSKIEFLNLSLSGDYFCCFGGGGIGLESIYASGKKYNFSTFCRTSVQFAEACEFMMRQVNDEELKRILAAQDKYNN